MSISSPFPTLSLAAIWPVPRHLEIEDQDVSLAHVWAQEWGTGDSGEGESGAEDDCSAEGASSAESKYVSGDEVSSVDRKNGFEDEASSAGDRKDGSKGNVAGSEGGVVEKADNLDSSKDSSSSNDDDMHKEDIPTGITNHIYEFTHQICEAFEGELGPAEIFRIVNRPIATNIAVAFQPQQRCGTGLGSKSNA